MTKQDKVMNHLIEHGSITSWEAIQEYRATRLSAIIYNLRHKLGMNIESEDVWFTEDDGRKNCCSRYVLKEK